MQTSDLCRLLKEARSSTPRVRAANRGAIRTYKKLSSSRSAEIVAAYEAGTPIHKIARQFRIHRITVSNHLEQAGVTKRPKGPTEQQMDEIVRLYEEGDSFAMIARRLGFSPMSISHALRKRGAEIRPRPGR